MASKPVEEELQSAHDEGSLARRIEGWSGPAGELESLMAKVVSAHDYDLSKVIDGHPNGVGSIFESMSDDTLRRWMGTLLPRLALSVVAAWEALARTTYQSDHMRMPFRCPSSPVDLATMRAGWLIMTARILGDYDRDILWVAAWADELHAPYESYYTGWLLAGELSRGGRTSDELLEVLRARATGEHDTARMARHVPFALMASSRVEAWEINEQLLLSANRQEGLRQSILEAVDESHPEAFRRMLRLILDENLSRFSSVVRAVDTWFGFGWHGSSGVKVDQVLDKVLRYFDDPAERQAAIEGDDAESTYLALWTIAFHDVDAVIPVATPLLEDSGVEKRFVATHLLAQAGWKSAYAAIAKCIGDSDLRVAARALLCFTGQSSQEIGAVGLFDALDDLGKRIGASAVTLEPIVWPWMSLELRRGDVATAMMHHRGEEPTTRIVPIVKELDPQGRATFIYHVTGLTYRSRHQPKDEPKRLGGGDYDAIVSLIGDASRDVRNLAFDGLASTSVQSQEADRIVALLKRKSGDLRNRCLGRLRLLSDTDLLAVVDRLLTDKDKMRRLGGLELLQDAAESDRVTEEVRARARSYRAGQPSLSDAELTHLDAILGANEAVPELADALGLIDPSKLCTWSSLVASEQSFDSPAGAKCIDTLAQLILRNRDVEVGRDGQDAVLLIDAIRHIPWPVESMDDDERGGELPLAETWRAWSEERPDALRDADGLELLRAWTAKIEDSAWSGRHAKELAESGRGYGGVRVLNGILTWCIHWEAPNGALEFMLDGLESVFTELDQGDLENLRSTTGRGLHLRRDHPPHVEKVYRAEEWMRGFRSVQRLLPRDRDPRDGARLFALLRWFQLETGGHSALGIGFEDFMDAYDAGAFGDAGAQELIALLVGPDSDRTGVSFIGFVTGPTPPARLEGHEDLVEAVELCRRRIVEVECQRGDRETAATWAAKRLQSSGGLDALALAMAGLGATKFARSQDYGGGGESRQETLSQLVLRSRPRDEDTPEAFAAWVERASVSASRLVELAAYAPHWAGRVSGVLGWPGLESAVWWIHGHTKETRWRVRDLREQWAAQVSERTPLSPDELTEGAVDVAWFRAVYAELGADRWHELDRAAKFASSAGGHRRAQLFASAMLGEVTRDELVARIDEKRHQDTVRALGLLPLATGKARSADLLRRYQRLQDFRRESRKFGAQRRESEGRAVAIAMDNLARTAGFEDPLRLQWAMEKEAVRDLAEGPVVVRRDDVAVELSIDDDGRPEITVYRRDRRLKAVPAKLRKDAEIVELRERVKELRRQASRVRIALEEAMCRGDTFDGDELRSFLEHPVLAPSLKRLVFVGDGIAGYPVQGGLALADHAANLHPVGKSELLRIAHPHDLLQQREWASWQRECFRSERVQPFKQVFRELYPVTAAEANGALRSRRYAGHQVKPRQALSLLGNRGWVFRPDEGIGKTYHREGLTARLDFDAAFDTPADIEGLTLESVTFTEKGRVKEIALESIPARVFSETMRDLDLVVSVAHEGRVDPEVTASTLAMRASLLREACGLLKLENVDVKESLALVRGELAEYSVHLGSAVARVVGGPSLVIIAVHSQHRGRFFLPFADDDPRTAEVLSKVLLLARDGKIQDPSVLEQIPGSTRSSGEGTDP